MLVNCHSALVAMLWCLSLIIFAQTITLCIGSARKQAGFHDQVNLERAALAGLVVSVGAWGSYRVQKMAVPSTHHVSAIIASASALFILVAKWLPVMVANIRRSLVNPSRYHYHCNDSTTSYGPDETVCRVIKADAVFFIFEWFLLAGLAMAMVGRCRQVRDLDHTGAYSSVGVYNEDVKRRNLSYVAVFFSFTTVIGVVVWMASWLWLVDARAYYPVADFAAFDLLWISFAMSVLLCVGRGSAVFTAVACCASSFVYAADWLYRIRSLARGPVCSADFDTCSGIKAAAAGEGIWLFSQLILAMVCAVCYEARMRGDTHEAIFEDAKPHYNSLPAARDTVAAPAQLPYVTH